MDKPAAAAPKLAFETHPSRYRHWNLAVDGDTARLTMKVQPFGGQDSDLELKSNSYDLAVDASGSGAPSHIQAGLDPVPPTTEAATGGRLLLVALVTLAALGSVVVVMRSSSAPTRPAAS